MPRPALAVVYFALMAAGGFMLGSRSTPLQSSDTVWYEKMHVSEAESRRFWTLRSKILCPASMSPIL